MSSKVTRRRSSAKEKGSIASFFVKKDDPGDDESVDSVDTSVSPKMVKSSPEKTSDLGHL